MRTQGGLRAAHFAQPRRRHATRPCQTGQERGASIIERTHAETTAFRGLAQVVQTFSAPANASVSWPCPGEGLPLRGPEVGEELHDEVA